MSTEPRCQFPGCTMPAICEPPDDDTPTFCFDHCPSCSREGDAP